MQRKVTKEDLGRTLGKKERAQKGGTLVGRIHGDGGLAFPD